MAIKIDKGIPLPEDTKRPRGELHEIYLKMEVGDSIWLPGVKKKNQCYIARNTCRRKGLDHSFTAREILLDNVKGLRIWRIK